MITQYLAYRAIPSRNFALNLQTGQHVVCASPSTHFVADMERQTTSSEFGRTDSSDEPTVLEQLDLFVWNGIGQIALWYAREPPIKFNQVFSLHQRHPRPKAGPLPSLSV
jgi:hypothetical protein